jgi:beta-galactosidase GanA
MRRVLLVVVLVLALPSAASAHTVAFDKYSLKVDGQRVYLWSGEIHPYRLPSPDLWRDVLQKMKANGYNGVSIYVDWAYHSPKPGVYDFSGVRDLDRFFDIANELGIYVMVRPGPYINAEVDAGGFPGWLTTKAGTARTNNANYMSYTDEYQSHIDPIIARHQLTNDTGTVILYQIENEYANNVTSQTGIQYMKHLYDKARADGITVPILHNDKGRNGYWVPGAFTGADGLAGPNLYGFDGYPGGTCSTSGNPGTPGTPPDWGYFGTGGATGGASASPNTPGAMIEFGGGWFDPWGDQLFGGKGYPCLALRQNGGYERDYYLTALANGIKIQNIYMTFGGTNWGWLPAPVVYTSYDYGAAWDEARQPRTDKVAAMKAMGYMVQSVAPLSQLDKVGTVAASDAGVKVYHLVNPDTQTHVYLPRHTTQSSSDLKFTFPISTPDGDYTIPQSGSLELKGEDMKALLANYSFDSQHLVYSTADVMTHAALPGTDVLVVQGRPGQTGETVLRYASEPPVDAPAGVTTSYANGDLRIDYPINGFAEVKIGGEHPLRLLIADDDAVATLWRENTSAGPVIVRGPELVRTASVSGDTLNLTGDTKDATDLQVWGGPANVTWNGAPVTGQLAKAPEVTLPEITGWRYRPESPEAQPSFDDSAWANADKTTSNSRTAVPSGQKVLFADDYGFHNGPVWYRGSYAGTATQVRLSFQTGTVGLLQAWLDGQFLGSSQTPVPTSGQATTATWSQTATFDIPAALQTDGPHKLAVMVNAMGHEEDGGANDAFKNARGLTSATLPGTTTTIAWKIQGNQGGEDITDPVRGFVNESGLYGERAGWHLPGYPDSGWAPVSLPYTDPNPGTAWYRTTFDLDTPADADASLGLNIDDPATKAYRALIFVNGWNLGQYINNVGPQHTFVLPNGILRQHGRNTLAIAVTSNAPGAGGLGTVTLKNLGTSRSSLTVNDVASPAYARPTLHPAVLDGTTVDGPVATLDVPPDALGTAFAATIDWGDGTTSDGTVTATTVNGSHTYAQPGRHHVTVTLSDRYGAAVLDSATADTGTVGGTVPATLSLSVGSASFGAFTPGVDRTYTAQTTANVISTAGDAALSVSDPGHLTNGAFSLPDPLQVSLSKATWTGPVSNDPVAIVFTQHIGASDALRTGAYAKTLTFTLSTTAP